MKKVLLISVVIFGLSLAGCGVDLNEDINGEDGSLITMFETLPGGTSVPEGFTMKYGLVQVSNTTELAKIFGNGVSTQDVLAKMVYKTQGSQVDSSAGGELTLYAKKNGQLYYYKFGKPVGVVAPSQVNVVFKDAQGTMAVIGGLDTQGKLKADFALDCHRAGAQQIAATCTSMGRFDSHI